MIVVANHVQLPVVGHFFSGEASAIGRLNPASSMIPARSLRAVHPRTRLPKNEWISSVPIEACPIIPFTFSQHLLPTALDPDETAAGRDPV